MDMSPYIKGHQALIEAEEQRRNAFFEDAMSIAREISRILTLTYPRVEVILFGSLATGLYDLDSDIDLAVKGLSEEDFSRALKIAESIAGALSIDLVRIEYSPEALRKSIEQEGVIL